MTTVVLDVPYGGPRADPAMRLDLHLPPGPPPPAGWPLVVLLHGGGGTTGDKAQGRDRAAALTGRGLACACVQYRIDGRPGLSHQLGHIRSALGWLRADGAGHEVDGRRVVLWGISSGGHLAALAGLEATRRDTTEMTAEVTAVVSWFAATDLTALAARTPLEARLLPASPVQRLLPGSAGDQDALRQASPALRVTADAPPFLIGHGDRDHMVPESHGRALHDSLVRHGVPSTMLVVGGAGHDDPRFDDPEVLELVAGFARRHLRPTDGNGDLS